MPQRGVLSPWLLGAAPWRLPMAAAVCSVVFAVCCPGSCAGGGAPGCLRGGRAQRLLPVFKCVHLGVGVSWNPAEGSSAALPVGQVGPASLPLLWRPLEPQSTGQPWAGVVETLLNIFLEGLLCAGQCAQSWGYSAETAKQLLPPQPHGTCFVGLLWGPRQ